MRASTAPAGPGIGRRWSLSAAAWLVLGCLATAVWPAPPAEAQQAAEQLPDAVRGLMLDVVATPQALVAVGDRGHILRSTDGGRQWTQMPAPVRSMLTGVTADGGGDGSGLWAVGHDAVLLRSEDAGQSWDLTRFDPEAETPLLDIWMGADGVGLAVGAYGLALRTTDGVRWDPLTIDPEEPHFYALAETAAGDLILVGEFGKILRSADRGARWAPLPSPYGGSYFGVMALTSGGLLVYGLQGNLFRTDDAGQSWWQLSTGTQAAITGGVRLPDGQLLLTGLSGTLLLSEDDGLTFTLVSRADRLGLATAVATDQGLVLVGENGPRHFETVDRALVPDSLPTQAAGAGG